MGEELFSRLKKLAKSKGEVIVTNEKGDDALVIMSLDRYEDLIEDFNLDFNSQDYMNDIDFSSLPPSFAEATKDMKDEDKKDEEEVDEKELMKRVNEDIAKWREEQEKTQEQQEEKKINILVNVETDEKEEGILTEEEKYYLEPLE